MVYGMSLVTRIGYILLFPQRRGISNIRETERTKSRFLQFELALALNQATTLYSLVFSLDPWLRKWVRVFVRLRIFRPLDHTIWQNHTTLSYVWFGLRIQIFEHVMLTTIMIGNVNMLMFDFIANLIKICGNISSLCLVYFLKKKNSPPASVVQLVGDC